MVTTAEWGCISGAEIWTHSANVLRRPDDELRIEVLWRDARRLMAHVGVMHWSGVPRLLMLWLARMRRSVREYTEPFTAHGTSGDGEAIQLGCEGWRVVHTPGHTRGLICLYQPEKKVFLSSDHLLRDISSNPIPDHAAPSDTEPPRRPVRYLEQLRRMAKLDVALALPGHGPPIVDHRALILRRLCCHEHRADRRLGVLNEEPLVGHGAATWLFAGLDPINAFLEVSEVVGHLRWLRSRGQLEQDRRLGVALWRAIQEGAK